MLTPKRCRERGDLGDDALAVEHRDAQLDQRLLDREPGGEVAAGGARVGEQREQRVAVAVGHDARARRVSSSR